MMFVQKHIRRTLGVAAVIAATTCFLSFPQTVSAQSYNSQAATEVRIQELEQEIRRLTGMVEEQNYEIRKLKELVEKLTGDLAMRVNDLEKGGGRSTSYSSGNSSLRSGDTVEPQGSQSLVERTENGSSFFYNGPDQQPTQAEDGQVLGTLNRSGSPAATPLAAYERAFGLLKKSSFDQAELEFARFLQDYPESDLAPNAKYWYGETFYVRGEYEKASRIFAEGYQQNPKGGKAADNLLKLGLSLAGLNKKEDACIALGQLEKDFSKTSGPIIRRARQEMSKLGC